MSDAITLEAHNPDWAAQADRVKTQLQAALGRSGHGGAIWAAHHIGSTAILDIRAKPVLDICLEVYPNLLDDAQIAALEGLGYAYKGEAGIAGRQFFKDDPRTVHLHVFKLDSPEVAQHKLFRDYLNAHPDHASRYDALKLELATRYADDREAYTLGKHGFIAEALALAQTWWLEEIAFQPVQQIAAEFAGADFQWLIGAGWALDAWLERVNRVHHDVDVIVWRDQQRQLQSWLTARGWTLYAVQDSVYSPWHSGDTLELAVFQIHAYKGDVMLDLMLAERDATRWIYRRDPRVSRALNRATLETAFGFDALAPEIVLLFKSKSAGGASRSKDSADFERSITRLRPEARGWLRDALLVTDPRHPWLALL